MLCPSVGSPTLPSPPRLEEAVRPGLPELQDVFLPGPEVGPGWTARPGRQASPGPRPGTGGPATQGPDPQPAASPRDPPGPREREALEREKEQQDKLLAQQIYARMRAERELVRARLEAIRAELQLEIQRIWQEVMIRRRKVHDELLENWHKVLLG